MRTLKLLTSSLPAMMLSLLVAVVPGTTPASAEITFTDVTADAGLDQEVYRTATAHGLGINWIDWNNDGWADLFLGNGIDREAHLYQNNADGTFTLMDELLPELPNVELTGSTFADYDNDGDQDIYIYTDNEDIDLSGGNLPDGPANILLKNLWVENGETTVPGEPLFMDVTEMAGVQDLADPPFGDYPGYRSSTGTWLDYDRDGYVDLYVGHWVMGDFGNPASMDRLYRNNGDGTFTDVTASSEFNAGSDPDTFRPALASIAAHLDQDLYQDLYVVNVVGNHLDQYYTNDKDGTFTENFGNVPNGGPGDDTGAGMGISIADVELDGDFDVYITDIQNNPHDASFGNAFYLADGAGGFAENNHDQVFFDADGNGLLGVTSWGTVFADFNHDGYEDLFVGASVNTNFNHLFRNNQDGTFTDVADQSDVLISGGVRGAAVADYDGDGDMDLALVNQTEDGNIFLLRNDTPEAGNWLKVKLTTDQSNRSAIGALVRLRAEQGGPVQKRQIIATQSTHSQNEMIAHFGVSDDSEIFNVRVTWPSGAISTATAVPVNQTLELVEEGALALTFTDVTLDVGIDYEHGYTDGINGPPRRIAAGVAAGDYNQDGWTDLYVERGNIGPNLLFENQAGTFVEVGATAGVDVEDHTGSGPTFGDLDGDGWLDLIMGGVDGATPLVFRNLGNGSFEDITAASQITGSGRETFAISFRDFNNDNQVDLAMSHWGADGGTCNPSPCTGHLWLNNGDGTFSDHDVAAGMTGYEDVDRSFTPNWADIDGDGDDDLLMASDFNTSKVFENLGGGSFSLLYDETLLTDDHGMGATVGDFDNDGDFDWFVSSIYDPDNGDTGNRLYENDGTGFFVDSTDATGVRIGDWGWGGCFQDFDNDGWLDLLHTNGFSPPEFQTDNTKLFMSNQDGTFTELALALGLEDNREGRGVACFDYDRDGDVDLFVSNNSAAPTLWRNDGGNAGNYLTAALRSRTSNVLGVGAKVYATAGGITQLRQLDMGTNFVSQQPGEIHFGFGNTTTITELKVVWPDGIVNTWSMVPTNQFVELKQMYDSIGTFLAGSWDLRNTNDAGPADETIAFGPAGGPHEALAGDFDGDGLSEVGLYHPTQGLFSLRNDDGTANNFVFGPVGVNSWLPVAGDWDGDGVDTIGVFNTVTFEFQLRNSNDAGPADIVFAVNPGGTNWFPVAGDWDGDGLDGIGLYKNGRVLLKNETTGGGGADLSGRITTANPGTRPVIGDWTGDGIDDIGAYDKNTGEFHLKFEVSIGAADLIFAFGPGGDVKPVAGEWN